MLSRHSQPGSFTSPQVITTERVSIYPVTSFSLDQLALTLRNNLANLLCSSNINAIFLHYADSPTIAEQMLELHRATERFYFPFFSNDQLIGFISSSRDADPRNHNIHLDFWFDNSPLSEQLCIEAILCIMKHHYENDHTRRFTLTIPIGNINAERIAKLLGFKLQSINLQGDQQLKSFSITELSELSDFIYHISL